MASLVPYLVLIHILTAIVAFGPTFAFPIVGAAASREPQHANFAARVNDLVSHRLVTPLALTMPVSGLLIVWAAGYDLFTTRWLEGAIAVYIVAIGFAFMVLQPASAEVIRLGSTPPPPGAAPAGPPPELLAAVAKVRRSGMVLSLLIVVIVSLMVLKPGV